MMIRFALATLLVLFVFGLPKTSYAKKTYEGVLAVIETKAKQGTLLKYVATLYKNDFESPRDWYRILHKVESISAKLNEKDYLRICLAIAKNMHQHSEYNREYYYLYKAHEHILAHKEADQSVVAEAHEMLGWSYYWFRRYNDARKHLLIADSWKQMPDEQRIPVLNTLGLINRDQNFQDSSAIYYHAALDLAEKSNNQPWIGVLSGNLGYYHLQKGERKKAIPLLEKDLQISLASDQLGSAFQCFAILMEIDLYYHDIEAAKKRLRQMEEMLPLVPGPENTLKFYKSRTSVFEAQGDYRSAWENYKKAAEYEEQVSRKHDIENIRKAESLISFERNQAEIQLLKEKRKRSSIVLTAVIIIAALVCVLFFNGYRSIKRRREKDKELSELKEKQLVTELKTTEDKMQGILSKLMERNTLVEQLTEEVERFNASQPSSPNKKELKLLEKLQSTIILTDDDWVEFKQLFERLNPGFFQRIKVHFPDLSNAELRLVALIKLDLSVLEMGRVLGISPDSVRKTSQRLRRKLDMDHHEDLVRFVATC